MDIPSALAKVKSEIDQFEKDYRRPPGSVELLAVSKKKPVAAILQAAEAGQRAFGENYVDEGVAKVQDINDDNLIWHYIGAIQSRKTAQIAEHFQWAHGVDRLKIARRLSEQRPSSFAPLNVCLQVNLDNEPSKAGVRIEEVAQLAKECADLKGIRVRGLMAIPASRDKLIAQREVLARLRQALEPIKAHLPEVDTLSMGMSADMEAAIAEGATIVRVGTAIFGARDT